MTDETFDDLFPSLPRIDREWEARQERLMALTADERVAAMRAGQLSYRELAHWSAIRPDEVPRISTGSGPTPCTSIGAGGEFEWIAALTPEIAEATDVAAQADGDSARAR